MSQLSTLKGLLPNASESDEVLQFYLDDASSIICDIRHSDVVESKYLTTQIKIAIELYNKRGIEGQTSSGELGISRGYEKAGISPSLLSDIIPYVRTPSSVVRTIT